MVRSSHPQKAPRRRSSATPHKEDFEDGGEVAVFQQPACAWSEPLGPDDGNRASCLPVAQDAGVVGVFQ